MNPATNMNSTSLPTYERLLQQVADLTAANEKLRKWKSIALECDLDVCSTCEEFIESGMQDKIGYCNICHHSYCSVCWKGLLSMREPTTTTPLILSDPFTVCSKCVDVCGTCSNAEVGIICPKKNCEQSFCSEKCFVKHCEKVDAERGLPAK